jgi:radical SAM superfamily enzyme YgiQ (UPF0313 family)
MRVLFIFPSFSLGREPLGILYLSSALKAHGHETMAVPPRKEDAIRAVTTFRPDIIASSLVTFYHRLHLELNRWIKENVRPAPLSLFGGPHPTACPEMIYEDGVDGVCIGEGEEAFVELVNGLAGGGNANSDRKLVAQIGR